jgi:nitrogen fixation NifU-like protein
MDEIYRTNLLEHYRHPHHSGTLEHPDASYEDLSTSCGDRIRMDFALSDQQISDVRFDGRGCAISVAAASMLTDMLPGLSREQALAIEKEDILKELGIAIGSGRQNCATLGLKALKHALGGEDWDVGDED